SRVHEVPMCRQRIDPGEWKAHGGAALGDRAEWSDRACGMAALRMILLAYRRAAPSLTELVTLGVQQGAMTNRGWLHAGIARLAAGFGIPARAGDHLGDREVSPGRPQGRPPRGGPRIPRHPGPRSRHPHPRSVRLGPGL